MILSVTLRKFREVAKRIPLIMNIYLVYMVFRRMPIQDIFNFKKLSLFFKIAPYTMVNYDRLTQVYELTKNFEKKNIAGAFVECGVWRGGCAAVMAYVVNQRRSGRKIWLFDSFAGLPEPTPEDGQKFLSYFYEKINQNTSPKNLEKATVEDVRFLFFSKLKLDKKNINIECGWFKDTMRAAQKKIGDIAILRLDCDLYESNKCCLENLYDSVIKDGYIIINTYDSWIGTKKAVDEFLTVHNINVELKKIDYGGRYFQKP